MAVISLETLAKSPDSNVRFCLEIYGDPNGRKANIQIKRRWGCFNLKDYPAALAMPPPSYTAQADVDYPLGSQIQGIFF
ncbi:hypothetical protein MAALD49_13360 [Marinobacter shengliensis]|nr:hypothetical protein MAALD49_13360 [Marinobacter shengliensis]